jgi:hypothetical protein
MSKREGKREREERDRGQANKIAPKKFEYEKIH